MLQTPASLVLLLAEVAVCQVSHHIYSLTDLMATDSLGGGHGGHLYTVTVTPPPGFLASRAGSSGPFVTSRAASSSSGPFVTSRPASSKSLVTSGSAQQRVFLPTPLPSRIAPKPSPQQKSSKPVKSKKGEASRVWFISTDLYVIFKLLPHFWMISKLMTVRAQRMDHTVLGKQLFDVGFIKQNIFK